MSNKLERVDDKLDSKISKVEKNLDFISEKTINLKNLKYQLIEVINQVQDVKKVTITNCYYIDKLTEIESNNSIS